MDDSSKASGQASRGRRRALYAAAWVPLYAFYALVFLSTGEPPSRALPFALVNVLPPALLGIPALAACRRLEWAPGRSAMFFSLHGLLALLFAGGAMVGHFLLSGVTDRILKGVWNLAAYEFRISAWVGLLGILVYATLAAPSYALRYLARGREQEARATRAESLRVEAELRALRARLNPHFLFNTLHSTLALVREDPAAAEQALERLGDLLHYVLRSARGGAEEVALEEEWRFTLSYLELERLRLEDRLRLHARLDETARGCLVPALSLQPLVENAVRYAIAPRTAGGHLWIEAAVRGGELEVEVRDDGPGMREGEDPTGSEGGLGLRLVKQRLLLRHGARARFEAGSRPGEGFRVAWSVPARDGDPGLDEEEDEES